MNSACDCRSSSLGRSPSFSKPVCRTRRPGVKSDLAWCNQCEEEVGAGELEMREGKLKCRKLETSEIYLSKH